MKRIILFGSLLSVSILLLLPSAPAVEYNVALDSNKSSINDLINQIDINIKDIDYKKIKEKIKNVDFKKLKEKIDDIEIQKIIDEINGELTDQKIEPNCIITLTILKLILKILKSIVSIGSAIILAFINILALIIIMIIVVIELIILSIIIVIQATLSTLINIIDSILQKIYDIVSPNRIAAVSQ